MGQVFTSVGVHFFSDILTLFIVAMIVDFCSTIFKYLFISSFEIIYLTIGNSLVLWILSIGTLIYFVLQGNWWLGVYALAYYVLLSAVAGLPGMFIVDRLAMKILGCNPKNYVAVRFARER